MKSLQQFITENNNKPIEVVDPTSPNQCFDLVVKWADELSIPRVFPFRYAYQIYSNFGATQAQYFDKIFNSPDAIPKEGDIMVWSWYYNYAGGHTGVFKAGDVYKFDAFEQNDPTGSYAHVKNYKYDYVMGWLRPKNYKPDLTPEQLVAKSKEILLSNDNDFNKVYRLKQLYKL